MAAATIAASGHTVFGNKRVAFATLTSPANTNTWTSGLNRIDAVFTQIVEGTAAAADAATVTVSGGEVTLGIAGTVDSLYVMAIGD